MSLTNKKILKQKTQKHNKTHKNAKIWEKFDEEIDNNYGNKKNLQNIECIYDNINIRENCDACNSKLVTSDEGYLECTNNKCKIFYKDILDCGAEWRYYGADDNQNSDPTRCGMPINHLLPYSSYGCKIVCTSSSNYTMRKIRRYTEWQSMPYKEKALYDEFQLITNMATNGGISKLIIDEAMRYHKKISEAKTFRGLNRDGIIAASIYISCSKNSAPRTSKEIANIFHLDNSSATKGVKNAVSIINELEIDMNNNDKTLYTNTTPLVFIERYCTKLNINEELTKLSKFIAQIIDKNNIIPENTPPSIAEEIVYFVSKTFKLNISKQDVNNVSQISEVTINKCYKKLETYKTKLIPNQLLNKYNINV